METGILLKSNSNLFLQRLVILLHEFEGDLYVSKGIYVVDARSVLGLLSLAGLSGAHLNGDITEELEKRIEKLHEEFSYDSN